MGDSQRIELMKNFDLKKQKIWVFGGAGYLGGAIVRALDAGGAETVCFDRPGLAEGFIDKEHLQNTTPGSCDLFDLDGIAPSVETWIKRHGVPDGVVNLVTNSSRGKQFEEISAADFQSTCEGVLTAGFLLGRAVAEAMRASKIPGSLVFFSSMYGVVSPDPGVYAPPHAPNPVDYGVAKAGLLQMARYFAVRYAPDGIRCNCITPGAFPNPTFQETSPQTAEALLRRIPMRRFGTPEEIVAPALFLLSEGASYMTGQSLVVDGGWTAW